MKYNQLSATNLPGQKNEVNIEAVKNITSSKAEEHSQVMGSKIETMN